MFIPIYICSLFVNIISLFTSVYMCSQKVNKTFCIYPGLDMQNIVASADLASVLNLNAIAIGLWLENIGYEPEQFPGLVYRID